MILRLSLLLATLFFLPQQAMAHKIHVFAWVSGDTVTVESSFSENRPLIREAYDDGLITHIRR